MSESTTIENVTEKLLLTQFNQRKETESPSSLRPNTPNSSGPSTPLSNIEIHNDSESETRDESVPVETTQVNETTPVETPQVSNTAPVETPQVSESVLVKTSQVSESVLVKTSQVSESVLVKAPRPSGCPCSGKSNSCDSLPDKKWIWSLPVACGAVAVIGVGVGVYLNRHRLFN